MMSGAYAYERLRPTPREIVDETAKSIGSYIEAARTHAGLSVEGLAAGLSRHNLDFSVHDLASFEKGHPTACLVPSGIFDAVAQVCGGHVKYDLKARPVIGVAFRPSASKVPSSPLSPPASVSAMTLLDAHYHL